MIPNAKTPNAKTPHVKTSPKNVRSLITHYSRFPVSRILLIFFAAILLMSGCTAKQSSAHISETRLLLDTYCTITIHGKVDSDLLNEAFELCEEYEALFSITMENSDVWRINHAGGEPVSVDLRTIEVIKSGLEFGELSDGMFDITIGRLSRLWDFSSKLYDPTSHQLLIPSEADIAEALKTVDYTQIHIDGDTVRLINPHAWIDLGAIAKGYIGDKIAEFLLKRGVTGALIDLGGDVVAVGNRQDGSNWRVGVREPFGDSNGLLGVLEISGASVVSSGTYERRFEKDGKNYHHILDPNTGMPVTSDVISATVVTENALIGEGLSTIAVLMGSEKVRELYRRVPGLIGAVFVLENGEVLMFGDITLYD